MNIESDDDSDSEIQVGVKKQKTTYSTVGRKSEIEEEKSDSDEEDNEDDFRRQLRLEKEESERLAKKKTRIDPSDGTEYEYDEAVKGWFPKIPDDKFIQYQTNSYTATSTGCPSNETNKKPQNSNEFYLYNGKFYSWDSINNKWIDPTVPVYSYTDYLTGLKFKWNQESNQWQQVQNTQAVAPSSTSATNKEADKEKGWFDITEDRNTNVYVSGLPLDTTDEEFENLMTKYGIVAKDLDTGKLKAKLYRDENNEVKGDGRCTYLMPESVKLCLQLLADSMFKGHKIHVEKAKFEMKGNYDPNKSGKPKKRNKNKEKKLLEKQRQKLLGWDESEVQRGKHEKVVVIKGLFDLNKFDDISAKRLKEELEKELAQYGNVRKIIVNYKNPEGVATVSFKTVDDADNCCEYLNDRVWKNGRIITCETWDGKTRYDVEETDEERQKRIDEWHKFLEADDDDEDEEDEEMPGGNRQ